MATRHVSDAEREKAHRFLRSVLDDGATVYTVLRSVSRSGMSRTIDMYALEYEEYYMTGKKPVKRCLPVYLSGYAADLCGFDVNRKSGFHNGYIIMRGCGLDHGLSAVQSIAKALGITLNHQCL